MDAKNEYSTYLLKENEILSKLIKKKLNGHQALNELNNIMLQQSDYIAHISDEHYNLEQSIKRLVDSIDDLKQKNLPNFNVLDDNKVNNNRYQLPNVLSFSGLNLNNNMTTPQKTKNISMERLMQISKSDFHKKKLKPINK